MKKYFVAISRKGAEFFYIRHTAILTPTKTAAQIADFLNKIQYKINDTQSEIWTVHEADDYTTQFIDKEIKRFSKAGSIKIYRA